jgi:heme-degrading monooxygenase HmoA
MAIVMKMVATGGTIEQYEQVNAELGIDEDNPPDGLILHALGITDDGLMLVDVWESPEKLQAFFESGLQEALENAGIETSQPEIHTLHNMIPQGAGTEANVMVEIEIDATSDVYDEMAAKMPAHADESSHPVTVHIAGVTEDGKLYVLDLWESAEAFGAFAESQIAPNAPEGLEVNPRIVPVHRVLRGNASVSA